MGWWKLKPEMDIDPHRALSVNQENILDFVEFTKIEDGYEIQEHDKEHIYTQVREGTYAGEINDWDWKEEQKMGIVV